jgi:hypothetical protein
MNAKNFIDALRKVIKEEVRSAVREEFSKMSLNESKRSTTFKVEDNILQDQYAVKKKPVVKKQLSKNSMINDLLNETAGFGRMDYGEFDEWPTMQTSMNAMMGSPRQTSMTPMTDTEGRRVNAQELPDHVVSALTKDYSALMKAIDKKKGLI